MGEKAKIKDVKLFLFDMDGTIGCEGVFGFAIFVDGSQAVGVVAHRHFVEVACQGSVDIDDGFVFDSVKIVGERLCFRCFPGNQGAKNSVFFVPEYSPSRLVGG